jgi:hypothetical protein
MVAIAQDKYVPGLAGDVAVPIYRFYFDGLIAHFHRPPAHSMAIGPLALGFADYATITTVTYEGSWQLENLSAVRAESDAEFPSAIGRLLREGRAT